MKTLRLESASLIVALAATISLIALMVWALAQTGGNPGGLGINNQSGEIDIEAGMAPLIALPEIDGRFIDISEFKGQIVMVDFWSSWCPPCVAEASDLTSTYELYKSKDVAFVGIAIWDEESKIRRHMNTFAVNYPNAIDFQGKVAIAYGVRGIPEKFFLDRKGNIVKKYVGPISSETLSDILDGLISTPV
ncbi:MAG: cytochrome c biogenesis protein CcmG, thiol:disulfide interchange protein DsbE [Chloroflexi bacterium]|jgi:cytochrome c biogenesis protein CcmG/thiol:disulfide interchange protein DsbE|nr:MAG: cytochrome c biogenesis protein CcmG, thiol:disulfide interchange protein DsbE [Chloroflexota bacterium]